MSDDDQPEDLAEQRTDLSEDRTVLANERTFASWFRTGFASAAIGLGFHALFERMEPWWVPRLIASLFLLLGIFIFAVADFRAGKVLDRLSAHQVKPFRNRHLRLLSAIASIGIVALLLAMWFLPITSR